MSDGRYPAKRKMTKIQMEDGPEEGASLGEADGVYYSGGGDGAAVNNALLLPQHF